MPEKTQEELDAIEAKQVEKAEKLAAKEAAKLEAATLEADKQEAERLEAEQAHKIELTETELSARIESAIKDRETRAAEQARLDEAQKQGDYKVLLDEANARAHKAELSAWRGKAIAKYKLSEKCFDFLSGDTEDEIMKDAKVLRSMLDEEVKEQEEFARVNHLPRDDGRRKDAPNAEADAVKRTYAGLNKILHLENTQRISH